MSNFPSYPTRSFSETQKFFVLDPQTGTPSFVLGSDLVNQLTPNSNYVFAESTRATAQATDYQVGQLIQTAGSATAGDGLASGYLVVPSGDGDFPMDNGNELLVISGDDALREQLISNASGEGSDLVAHTGTANTVTETLDQNIADINQRVIYVGSVAAMLAETSVIDGQAYYVTQGPASGPFIATASDISSGVTADPEGGVYQPFTSDPTGASGGFVRQYGQAVNSSPNIYARWFGSDADLADNSVPINAARSFAGFINSGEVILPAGTIKYTQDIDWVSNLKLLGQGAGTLLQGDGAALRVSGIEQGAHVTDWQMESVKVERIGVAGPAILLDGDGTPGSNKGQIRFDMSNVWIKGSTGDGLVLRNTYIGNFYNPILRGCAGAGFRVELDTVAGVVGANAINIYGGEWQSNDIGAVIGSCAGLFLYGTIVEGNANGGIDLQGNVRQFAHIGGYYEANGNWDARVGSSAPGGFSHTFSNVVFFDGSGAGGGKANSVIGIRSLNCTIDTCGFIGYSGSPITNTPAAGGGFVGRARNCYTDSASLIANEDKFFRRDIDEMVLTGSAVWDIPSLASGASAQTTVTVTGALSTDFAEVAASGGFADVILFAKVTSADTVTVTAFNAGASTRDPGTTTYRVMVTPSITRF